MSARKVALAAQRRDDLLHEMHSPPAAAASLSTVRRDAFVVRRFRALEAAAGDHITCGQAGIAGTDHMAAMACHPSRDSADLAAKLAVLVLELADDEADRDRIAEVRFRLAASALADAVLLADGEVALPQALLEGQADMDTPATEAPDGERPS